MKVLVGEGIVGGVVVIAGMVVIVRDAVFFGEVFLDGRDFVIVVLGGKIGRGCIVKETPVEDSADSIDCVVGEVNPGRWRIG